MTCTEDIKRVLGVTQDKDVLPAIQALQALSTNPKDYLHVESIEANVGRITFSITLPVDDKPKQRVNLRGEIIITAMEMA